MNDEIDWIVQAQHGSDAAFTRLVEAYQTHIYNMCYRMLGEPESAEDASQETFLRAFQHLGRYDQKRPFGTWLLSIAAHYCIDRLRRRRFSTISTDQDEEGDALDLPDGDSPDPEAEVVRNEQQEQIQAALGRLESIDRAAIVLRYWHDYSEAEIAATLNLTVSAVKSRLHRARRVLAGSWKHHGPPPRLERRQHESLAF